MYYNNFSFFNCFRLQKYSFFSNPQINYYFFAAPFNLFTQNTLIVNCLQHANSPKKIKQKQIRLNDTHCFLKIIQSMTNTGKSR